MGPKRAQGTRLAHPEEEEALGILRVGWCSKKVSDSTSFQGGVGGAYEGIWGSPQGLLWGLGYCSPPMQAWE